METDIAKIKKAGEQKELTLRVHDRFKDIANISVSPGVTIAMVENNLKNIERYIAGIRELLPHIE